MHSVTVSRIATVGLAMLALAGCTASRHQVSIPATGAPAAAADRMVQPLIDSGKTVGAVVGVSCRGRRYVFGYGSVAAGHDRTPDGDTLFEIGSVTKVFTTLLLADMAAGGLVSLDDPVRLFLPDSVRVPSYGTREITLIDLATQTSGLPRLPSNLWGLGHILSPGSLSNPYAHYTENDLYAFLSGHTLRREPGSEFLYSNLGMGLLGNALCRAAGSSYEELVVKRIAAPLGMNDTRIRLTEEQASRMARGYQSADLVLTHIAIPTANWDIPGLAGAGALRSTANDMLEFLDANMRNTHPGLSQAAAATHVPRHVVSEGLQIGMGWLLLERGTGKDPIVWHNGGTGGYRSFAGFVKECQVGVVVLSNSSSTVDPAGLGILEALCRRATASADRTPHRSGFAGESEER